MWGNGSCPVTALNHFDVACIRNVQVHSDLYHFRSMLNWVETLRLFYCFAFILCSRFHNRFRKIRRFQAFWIKEAKVCARDSPIPIPPETNYKCPTLDGRKLQDYYLPFYAPKFLIPISCSRLSVVMSHFLIRTRSATIMQ